MAGITQNKQKHLIFNVVPQLRIADDTGFVKRRIIIIIIIIIIINITIIKLTHSKTILENTVEIEPQPVALNFKNLSQYSSHSK